MFCYHFVMSIASSMIRFTASDYFFAIFRLFFYLRSGNSGSYTYTLIEIDTDICTFIYVEFVHMCFFLNVTHMALHVPNIQKSAHFNSKTLWIKKKQKTIFVISSFISQIITSTSHKKRLFHITGKFLQFNIALSTD